MGGSYNIVCVEKWVSYKVITTFVLEHSVNLCFRYRIWCVISKNNLVAHGRLSSRSLCSKTLLLIIIFHSDIYINRQMR